MTTEIRRWSGAADILIYHSQLVWWTGIQWIWCSSRCAWHLWRHCSARVVVSRFAGVWAVKQLIAVVQRGPYQAAHQCRMCRVACACPACQMSDAGPEQRTEPWSDAGNSVTAYVDEWMFQWWVLPTSVITEIDWVWTDEWIVSHAFSLVPPSIWKSLHVDTHLCQSVKTFKRHLKAHLFAQHSLVRAQPSSLLYFLIRWCYINVPSLLL